MTSEPMWSPGITLEEIEKQVILKALRFYRGNQTATAASLGITRKTLYLKLNLYEGKTNDGLGNDGLGKSDSGHAQKGPEGKSEQVISEAPRGAPVEPASEVPAKQPVHLREREKVQEMPSKSHGSGRRR